MADAISSPALTVAKLDLALVRMLRQAMRVADMAGGKSSGGADGVAVANPATSPRPHIHPTPQFEPRPHIHPTPRIEPRLVYRPTAIQPRIAPPPPVCDQAAPAAGPTHHKLPIEPPWKLLPCQIPTQPAPKLKVIQRHPDVANRGTLLDVFI